MFAGTWSSTPTLGAGTPPSHGISPHGFGTHETPWAAGPSPHGHADAWPARSPPSMGTRTPQVCALVKAAPTELTLRIQTPMEVSLV